MIVQYNSGQGGGAGSAIECSSSIDCPLEHFCSEGNCESGCREDADCLAGYECDSSLGQCEPLGCRQAYLDCEPGESCNLTTSECFVELESCSPCRLEDLHSEENSMCFLSSISQTPCTIDIFETQLGCSDSEICYPDDFSLYNSHIQNAEPSPVPGKCATFYRYFTASMFSNDECPASFESIDISSITGEPIYDMCIGDCEYLLNQGYLD